MFPAGRLNFASQRGHFKISLLEALLLLRLKIAVKVVRNQCCFLRLDFQEDSPIDEVFLFQRGRFISREQSQQIGPHRLMGYMIHLRASLQCNCHSSPVNFASFRRARWRRTRTLFASPSLSLLAIAARSESSAS